MTNGSFLLSSSNAKDDSFDEKCVSTTSIATKGLWLVQFKEVGLPNKSNRT